MNKVHPVTLNTSYTVPLVIFLISLVLYLALASWMTRRWLPLGDEPHYLLAAHSLAFDQDLDLANNYAQGDYRAFFNGETLDPHVKITSDGKQILNHDLGLVFAIAPAYALGGRRAVEYFLAFLAALLAVQIFLLAREVTSNLTASLLTWIALAFTPPLIMYATLIYPELLGALIVIWAARTLFFKRANSVSLGRVGSLAINLAVLPWLSIRFLIVLVLFLAYVWLQWSNSARRVALVYIVTALSLAGYFIVNFILFAGHSPNGTTTTSALGNQSIFSVARGLVGWWIDPERGTLILSPIYLIALAGIPRLLNNHLRWGSALVLPLALINLAVPLLGGFWVPFEVGARYFVIVLPLLAAPFAVALHAGLDFSTRAGWQRIALSAFAAILFLFSVWNSWLMIQDASYAYGSVLTAYNRALGVDLSKLFAGMGHPVQLNPQNTPVAGPSITTGTMNGEAVWEIAPDVPGAILQSDDLVELTNGNYNLTFRASAHAVLPEREVMTLDLYSPEGVPIVHSTLYGSDFAETNSAQSFVINFDNPYFDRWSFPLTLQMRTRGDTALTLGALTFDPDTPITWLRIGIWLVLIFAMILILNLDLIRKPHPTPNPAPSLATALHE